MALCEVKVHSGKSYARQLIYERNLQLLELAVKLVQLGITSNDLIIADSAEPLTINKLRNGISCAVGLVDFQRDVHVRLTPDLHGARGEGTDQQLGVNV